MKPSIIPFNCYPQFRSSQVTLEDVDFTWRECALLGSRVSVSVMPILNDEMFYESFARHDELWNANGCDILIRGNYSNLSELVEEHERLYAHLDNTGGDLDKKLKRAEHLERTHSSRFRRFEGGPTQQVYRNMLSGHLTDLLSGIESAQLKEAGAASIEEIGRYPKILDLAGALEIFKRNDADERFASAAHLAYYYVGATQFKSSPLIPAEHAAGVPQDYRIDLFGRTMAIAHKNTLDVLQVSPHAIIKLPVRDIIELSQSYVARDFSEKLTKIVEDIVALNLSSEETAGALFQRLKEQVAIEKGVERIFSNEALMIGGLGALSLHPALGALGWLGLLGFSATVLSRFYRNLRLTPMLTYLDRINDRGFSRA